MKKIFIALLATAILFAAVGCGSENGGKDEVRTVDISSAAQALAAEITFEDEIAPIDDEAVRYLYDLPDGVKAAVYSSSGATAEELALFDAGDESTAKAVLSVAREHIQSQLESFKNYNPDETEPRGESFDADVPSDSGGIDDAIALRRAVAELSPKLRTVVILRFFHGMSLTEIAEVTGANLSTIKTRLYRALDILKVELGAGFTE